MTYNMDLEEMKKNWESINARIDRLEKDIAEKDYSKMRTAQEKLVIKYRNMVILALSGAILFFIPMMKILSLYVAIAFSVFLLICMSGDLYLMKKVDSISLSEMTVAEVSEAARLCRRRHHQIQLTLLPLVVVLLAIMVMSACDEGMIIAMVIGCGVGTALGLLCYFKMMGNYKSLIRPKDGL